MKKLFARFSPAALIGMLLLTVGCLVSGTFIIVQDFTFTTNSGFYFYGIDLTTESEWEDHKDDIDLIDAVGLEFTIVNNTASEVTFNAYVDTYAANPGPSTVPGTATKIINDLKVAANTTRNVTYAQSLTFITGLDRLKSLVKGGKLSYFGVSSVTEPNPNFDITDGKIIVTFSASGSGS